MVLLGVPQVLVEVLECLNADLGDGGKEGQEHGQELHQNLAELVLATDQRVVLLLVAQELYAAEDDEFDEGEAEEGTASPQAFSELAAVEAP